MSAIRNLIEANERYAGESLICKHCGAELDYDRPNEPCYECRPEVERQAAEDEYWKEFNRNAVLTSQYNDGSELRAVRDGQAHLMQAIDATKERR
jgi:hypothetical protein